MLPKHFFLIPEVLGCDTSLRLHDIDKGVSLKSIKESKLLGEQVVVFNSRASRSKEVELTGEGAPVTINKGRQIYTLGD